MTGPIRFTRITFARLPNCTFSFGIIEAITGSMRYSVLAICIFFMIGSFFMLLLLRKGY
jgi:MFS-type transporter involved in bile tolerance (Atg22 family)